RLESTREEPDESLEEDQQHLLPNSTKDTFATRSQGNHLLSVPQCKGISAESYKQKNADTSVESKTLIGGSNSICLENEVPHGGVYVGGAEEEDSQTQISNGVVQADIELHNHIEEEIKNDTIDSGITIDFSNYMDTDIELIEKINYARIVIRDSFQKENIETKNKENVSDCNPTDSLNDIEKNKILQKSKMLSSFEKSPSIEDSYNHNLFNTQINQTLKTLNQNTEKLDQKKCVGKYFGEEICHKFSCERCKGGKSIGNSNNNSNGLKNCDDCEIYTGPLKSELHKESNGDSYDETLTISTSENESNEIQCKIISEQPNTSVSPEGSPICSKVHNSNQLAMNNYMRMPYHMSNQNAICQQEHSIANTDSFTHERIKAQCSNIPPHNDYLIGNQSIDNNQKDKTCDSKLYKTMSPSRRSSIGESDVDVYGHKVSLSVHEKRRRKGTLNIESEVKYDVTEFNLDKIFEEGTKALLESEDLKRKTCTVMSERSIETDRVKQQLEQFSESHQQIKKYKQVSNSRLTESNKSISSNSMLNSNPQKEEIDFKCTQSGLSENIQLESSGELCSISDSSVFTCQYYALDMESEWNESTLV
ncbi:unnamed protein product, partial [Meganyctiphanes norvegica]